MPKWRNKGRRLKTSVRHCRRKFNEPLHQVGQIFFAICQQQWAVGCPKLELFVQHPVDPDALISVRQKRKFHASSHEPDNRRTRSTFLRHLWHQSSPIEKLDCVIVLPFADAQRSREDLGERTSQQ